MIPEPLEAVIFDMDGVLLDTERLYREAIFAACADQGRSMADHRHLSLIGTPKDLGDAMLADWFGVSFDLGLYHTACSRYFAELCGPAIPLRPGVQDLLGYLRDAGVPLGVATSTRRVAAEPQLKASGILHFFHVLVTGTDVMNGKPHPESFLKAAAALNARPAHCLALEDSHNGVRAAAAAGMATVMVPDLLPPIPEITALCVGVLPGLSEVQRRLEAARSDPAQPRFAGGTSSSLVGSAVSQPPPRAL